MRHRAAPAATSGCTSYELGGGSVSLVRAGCMSWHSVRFAVLLEPAQLGPWCSAFLIYVGFFPSISQNLGC